MRNIVKKLSMIMVMSMIVTLSNESFCIAKASTLKGSYQQNEDKVNTEKYDWNRVNTGGGGGYIPNIIFNKTEKNLIYARTDMGGVYRYDNGKKKWIPLTDWVGYDDWNMLGAESLATDPVDTNRVYVAAGTYTNDWAGNGAILRSTDKGDTWEKIDLPFKLGGNMPGRSMGERLAIDPNSNNILYLGTHSNGLWKSEDYGKTWARVDSFKATGNYIDPNFHDQTGVVWVTFDKSSGGNNEKSQTIYIGVADTDTSIYRSTDGGETWKAVSGQPKSGYIPYHGVMSGEGKLYITYSNQCGPYDGEKGDVYKYDTKTGDWTEISPVKSSDKDDYYGYGGIDVDANNPETIVVNSISSWWPDTHFFRSTDGGKTWKNLWEWTTYPNRNINYDLDISSVPWLKFPGYIAYPESNPKIGWMTGSVAIDPFNSDRMMYGTGATLYGTENLTDWDKGKQVKITPMAQGIEEENVTCVICPNEGSQLLTGMYDVSGFMHKDISKVPDHMFSQNFNTRSMDYSENQSNFVVRVGDVSKNTPTMQNISFSYDGGDNWFSGNNINGVTLNDGGTVAAAVDASKVLWSPSANGKVSYSTNNGNSWTESKGIPIGAVVAADRVDKDIFYGCKDGDFYVSKDGGDNFTKTASNLPKGDIKVKAVSQKTGDIWVAGGNYSDGYGLYHSTDFGETFTKLNNVEACYTVGFGKGKTDDSYDAIYIHGEISGVKGFYRSDDEGKTFVRINDKDHQFGCANSDITGDPKNYGRVYIATNGLGVVYGDIAEKKEKVVGDVNGDSKVSLSDYVLMHKYILNKNLVSIDTETADINKDGTIDDKDLLLLRKKLIA